MQQLRHFVRSRAWVCE